MITMTLSYYPRLLIKYAAIFPLLLFFTLSVWFISGKYFELSNIENLAILMPAKIARFCYIAFTGFVLSHYLKERYTKGIFLAIGIFHTLLACRIMYYLLFGKITEYMNNMNELFWFGNIAMLIIIVSTLIYKEYFDGGFNIKKTMGRNRNNSNN